MRGFIYYVLSDGKEVAQMFCARGCVKLHKVEHWVCRTSYVDDRPLVIILTAAWLTGKSPVLTMGLSTRTTISVGSTDAIAVAQLSAARSTCGVPSELDIL